MQNNWNFNYRLPGAVFLLLLITTTTTKILVLPCNAIVSPFSYTRRRSAHSISAAFVDCCTPNRSLIRQICSTRTTRKQQCLTHSVPSAITTKMRLSNAPRQEETEELSRKMEMEKQSLFSGGGGDKDIKLLIDNNDDDDDDVPIIFRGEEGDDMPDELWQDIESGKPSEWIIMKDLLGINIFTYILAAAIIFFLGMNAVLGPGWLGGAIGLPGTGTFSEMSDSLPDILDLSESKYQL